MLRFLGNPHANRHFMVVSLRKKRARVLPYRIALWSVVAIVVFSSGIQDNPVTLDEEMELSEGLEITRTSDADVLVVLDYQAIRDSGASFSERDFSAAWITVVEREIGPVSIATPETLTADRINRSRVVILTHSVSAGMPESLLDRVRNHALDGHTVIVDRPSGRAREVFSADGGAGTREGQAVTHAAGMNEPFIDDLRRMPLFVDYVGSTAPREGATTLFSIDGAPVIYATEFGDGQVITVDFDLPRQLVSLQQGRPGDDFSVPRGAPSPSGLPKTSDLVADDDLLGAAVPYVDLLGRFVVYGVLMRYAAMPTYWLYPEAADGAVVFVHEDSRLGDGGAWQLNYERQQGGTSTLLSTADSGLTQKGAEAISTQGGHIGLAWRLHDPSIALYEPVGFGGFTPFRRPINLKTQLDELQQVVSEGTIRTARSLNGLWTTNWSAPFAALAEAGIRIDFSYETPTHRGYSFGSGLPYLTISDEGIPFSVRQYPVVVPADAVDGPTINELLADSAAGYHQLITIASRPSLFADYPDMEYFEQWLDLFPMINAHNHTIFNAAQFESHQRLRRAGSIRSRLNRRTGLPESLQSEQTAPNHQASMLRVTAEASERGMYLVIPERIGDATFFAALQGTERVGSEIVTNTAETEETSTAGFDVRRLRLNVGFNNLEVYYR